MSTNAKPLKNISQNEFRKLVAKSIHKNEIRSFASISLKDLLEENGYSPILDGINLDMLNITVHHSQGVGKQVIYGSERLKNIDYSGLTIKNCTAKGCNFTGSKFNDVKLINTNLYRAVFQDCQFSNMTIENCNLNDTMMNRSTFGSRTIIKKCDIASADFSQTKFKKGAKIHKTKLRECVFVDAVDNGAGFDDLNLHDCIISSTSEVFPGANITHTKPKKPIVGILWDPHYPGHTGTKLYEKIKKEGAIPVRISYLHDHEVTLHGEKHSLDHEVKTILNEYDSLLKSKFDKTPDKSRAMAIIEAGTEPALRDKNTEISKVVDRAHTYGELFDGFIIPGGNDIPPDLYGQEPHPESQPEDNYMRSILEFAMIEDQRNRGNPLLGICRGNQIVNVFYGGDLNQRVPEEGNFRAISKVNVYDDKAGILSNVLNEHQPIVISFHLQAIKNVGDVLQPGNQLEVIADYNDVVKAAQTKHGAPVILTQFHPEIQGESFSEIYNSQIGKWHDKLATATIGMAVSFITSESSLEIIANFVKIAHDKKKIKKPLIESISELGDTHRNKTKEARLLKPSVVARLNKKATFQDSVSNQISRLVKRYQQLRKKQLRDQANKSPIFKGALYSIYRFFDIHVFNRATQKVLKKLEESASEVKALEANEADAKISKAVEQCQALLESHCNMNSNSPLSKYIKQSLRLQDKVKFNGKHFNASKCKTNKLVNSHMKKYPSGVLTRAFKSHKVLDTTNGVDYIKKTPSTPDEIFAALENYVSKPTKARCELMKSLERLKNQHLEKIAFILSKGVHATQYQTMLANYTPIKNKSDWKYFKKDLKNIKGINDTIRISFSRKVDGLYADIKSTVEKMRLESTSIQTKKALEQEAHRLEITLNELLNKGPSFEPPQEMQDAFKKQLWKLPTNPHEWAEFKKTFTSRSEACHAVIQAVDSLQAQWAKKSSSAVLNYVQNNKFDPYAMLLSAQPNYDKLPMNFDQWHTFNKEYQENFIQHHLKPAEAVLLLKAQMRKEYLVSKPPKKDRASDAHEFKSMKEKQARHTPSMRLRLPELFSLPKAKASSHTDDRRFQTSPQKK